MLDCRVGHPEVGADADSQEQVEDSRLDPVGVHHLLQLVIEDELRVPGETGCAQRSANTGTPGCALSPQPLGPRQRPVVQIPDLPDIGPSTVPTGRLQGFSCCLPEFF